MSPIPTPCIGVCRQNPALRFCEGCGRTIQEVVFWSSMTDEERVAIRSEASTRLDQLKTPREAS